MALTAWVEHGKKPTQAAIQFFESKVRPILVDNCYECHKPRGLCVCGNIPRVDNRTSILVLQHPRERLHPIGTARFVRLGLARGECHRP